MSMVLIDPNARGDVHGMQTLSQTMNALLSRPTISSSMDPESPFHSSPLFILSHSASGAQLVQYIMDNRQFIDRIRAIVFTDSTHNIQWLKKDVQLYNWFQSCACLYIRSSNAQRDEEWEKHKAGDECMVDPYWQHRFGTIKTIWAGSKDHSISNWSAKECIWAHFDECIQ